MASEDEVVQTDEVLGHKNVEKDVSKAKKDDKVAEGSKKEESDKQDERPVQGELVSAPRREPSPDQGKVYRDSLLLILLFTVYAKVSQLNLSPVFGSIPSSQFHARVVTTAAFAGWASSKYLKDRLPLPTTQALPLIAIYIPVVQFYLTRFADLAGPKWGPLAIELLTIAPLGAVTASTVANVLEGADLSTLHESIAEFTPALWSWGVYKLGSMGWDRIVPFIIGRTLLTTRIGLELALASTYAAFARSRYLAYGLPALLHTLLLNTHLPTQLSNSSVTKSLAPEGWTLLDRQDSVTGYVSVVESLEKGFRAMRCDHSLLGGEWLRKEDQQAADPIYGAFVMLEAVRLVEREQALSDKDAQALVIGLGAGTAPSALVSHGINTTVVEVDPVVHKFAVEYFNYIENNPTVIEDAVQFTKRMVTQAPQTYDYIIHDVFTGGAVPLELFSLEFLRSVSALLKPDGVIAINYAGDFNQPTSRIIAKTITTVFHSCRFFRESRANVTAIQSGEGDFVNMVMFCRKTAAAGGSPLTFRKAVEADFLKSGARQEYLEPRFEVQQAKVLPVPEIPVFRKNDTLHLKQLQFTSAMGHWKLIRSVLPEKVWALW